LDEITKNQETIIKKIRNTKYKLTICGQRADFSLHNPIVIPAKAGIHYKLLDPVFQRDGDWGFYHQFQGNRKGLTSRSNLTTEWMPTFVGLDVKAVG
jgi:hypothetical protein